MRVGSASTMSPGSPTTSVPPSLAVPPELAGWLPWAPLLSPGPDDAAGAQAPTTSANDARAATNRCRNIQVSSLARLLPPGGRHPSDPQSENARAFYAGGPEAPRVRARALWRACHVRTLTALE